MGWLFAFGLAALTFLGLVLSRRCSRMALELAGAAILVALAGYSWQGSPGLGGQPTVPGGNLTGVAAGLP